MLPVGKNPGRGVGRGISEPVPGLCLVQGPYGECPRSELGRPWIRWESEDEVEPVMLSWEGRGYDHHAPSLPAPILFSPNSG